MASFVSTHLLLQLVLIISFFHFNLAARRLADTQQPLLFQYHKGPLLTGKISINLIWYGKFKPTQRAIISDFITSLSTPTPTTAQPSVATWWKSTEKYYHLINSKKPSTLQLSLGTQILDENYSLGKSLSNQQIVQLASKGAQKNAINVVLTSAEVAVEGFCMSQGWPWARARWATALGLTSKLGLIPKNFKALIERPQYIYI
jgi:hypothetical protein